MISNVLHLLTFMINEGQVYHLANTFNKNGLSSFADVTKAELSVARTHDVTIVTPHAFYFLAIDCIYQSVFNHVKN